MVDTDSKFKYKIYIPTAKGTSAWNMCHWAMEQGIIHQWQVRDTENAFGRGHIVGFVYYFQTEEDLAAFKLRWA